MKKIMKLFSVIFVCLIFSFSLFSNGLNLNSIGSKSSAMGTAFIGLADDFSAVFFNPAGLTQMKTTNLTLFGTDLMPTGNYTFDMALIDAETTKSMYPSGALGFFKPISDKLVLGIAAYVPSGLGAEWDGADLANLTGGATYNWSSMIFVITVSPAIAYKITDTLSVGATFNLNYGMLDTEQPVMPLGQYSEKLSGIAFGATFGILFAPADFISLGASLRTASTLTLDGDADMPGATGLGLPASSEASRDAKWPMVAGVGVALKPADGLTILVDAVWTNWGELDTIPVEYTDANWQTFFAADSEFDLRWEDTWQIKVGAEYWISDSIALRAGYYSDPAPGPIATQNILIPNIDYSAITVGFGYKSSKLAIDFGFEYIMGDDRVVPVTEPDAMPGTHAIDILVPNLTITFFFGGK
jgi:long-chain fatty acid transport protein